jgi:hypothetical protein
MDAGKVDIKIPAGAVPFEALAAIARRLDASLRREGLGQVASFGEVTYEPFTPECPEHGRRWNAVTLDLSRPMTLHRAAELFVAAGVPRSAHVTYTEQMHMCGVSLGA